MAKKEFMEIFGVEATPASVALAWALRKMSFLQKNGGRVVMTNSGGPGANFRHKYQAWVLHNQAWWVWGGAHNVVGLAAKRLAKNTFNTPFPQGLVLVNQTLRLIENKNEGLEAEIWGVARQSYEAWQNAKQENNCCVLQSE